MQDRLPMSPSNSWAPPNGSAAAVVPGPNISPDAMPRRGLAAGRCAFARPNPKTPSPRPGGTPGTEAEHPLRRLPTIPSRTNRRTAEPNTPQDFPSPKPHGRISACRKKRKAWAGRAHPCSDSRATWPTGACYRPTVCICCGRPRP